MKRSISNIAWGRQHDDEIYTFMQTHGFTGLEIAPTALFPGKPYEPPAKARAFAETLKARYGLSVSSMQSIWYGRTENIFGSAAERVALVEHTKRAVDFAVAAGCGNLVFGCPKNRNRPSGAEIQTAYDFFLAIAEYAAQNSVVIAFEPNPLLYGTNFVNTTAQAFDLVKHMDCNGFKVNIDCGTLIENDESLNAIRDNIALVNHVHISEPNLVKIERRGMHRELAALLRETDYDEFVSIEMKNPGDVGIVKDAMLYVKEIFP